MTNRGTMPGIGRVPVPRGATEIHRCVLQSNRCSLLAGIAVVHVNDDFPPGIVVYSSPRSRPLESSVRVLRRIAK